MSTSTRAARRSSGWRSRSSARARTGWSSVRTTTGAREALRIAGADAVGYGDGARCGASTDDRDAGPGWSARDARRRRVPCAAGAPGRRRSQPPRRGRRGGGGRHRRRSAPRTPPSPLLRSRASVVVSSTGGAPAARSSTTTTHTSPHELAVTLGVARARRPRRLVAVFQPHRYSRTQALWKEFGREPHGGGPDRGHGRLRREPNADPGVTGALVVDGVRRAAPEREVVYTPHGDDAISFLDRRGARGGPRDHARMWGRVDARGCRAGADRRGGRRWLSSPTPSVSSTSGSVRSCAWVSAGAADELPHRRSGRALRRGAGRRRARAVGRAMSRTGVPVAVIGKGSNVSLSAMGSWDRRSPGSRLSVGRSRGDLLCAGGAMPLPALADCDASPSGRLEFGWRSRPAWAAP